MPDVWERMMQLVPEGLRSWDEPIIIFIPASKLDLAHQKIPVGCMRVKNGMTKILSSWMLMLAALELEEHDRMQLLPVLKTFGEIQSSWDGCANVQHAVMQAISYKMSRSLTQRVDPDQLLDAFAPAMEAKRAEGAELTDEQLIDYCCNEYNSSQSVDGCKIDHHERRAAKFIHCNSLETRAVIKLAWCPLHTYLDSCSSGNSCTSTHALE